MGKIEKNIDSCRKNNSSRWRCIPIGNLFFQEHTLALWIWAEKKTKRNKVFITSHVWGRYGTRMGIFL